MDKTVSQSFDSDSNSHHSGGTMVTNVVQSFDQDSDKNSAQSGEAMITNEINGYNINMHSESLENRGYTNESYITDDHSDTVDPSNSITIIDRNRDVENNEISHVEGLTETKPKKVPEGGLWKANPKIKKVFTYLGLYMLKWNGKEYKVQKKKFMLAYIFWFVWPMIGLLLAYFGSLFLGIQSDITDDIKEEEQSMTQVSIFILLLALTPACQTYAIRVFSENLPSILKDISLLSEHDFGTYRAEADINLFKRYDDGISKSYRPSMDLLYNMLPEFTFIIAGLAFLASTIVSIVESTNRGSVFEEWYFLVMVAFYLFMPVFTTWFCIIFIEWHRKVYEKIHNEIKGIEPKTSAVGSLMKKLNDTVNKVMLSTKITNRNLITLGKYSDKIQDIFAQLSDGVFKYALGVNMLVFLATSTFCTARMLDDAQYIYYIFPLSFSAGHIILLCARSSDLMEEHGNVLSVLKDHLHDLEEQENDKEKPKDRSRKNLINSLHKLRENLLDSPPQVEILGSFTVDYGMLSTIIGFILSYALLINELFDDSTPVCNVVDPSIILTTPMSPATIITTAIPITTSTIGTDPGNPATLSGGEIAGIVVGSVAGVVLIGGVFICYIKKKLCFSKPSTTP